MTQVLAFVALLATIAAPAPILEPPQIVPNQLQCNTLDFSAERLECSKQQCLLSGNARIRCDSFDLEADSIVLDFREDGQLDKISAQDKVAARHELNQISCDKIQIAADGIRGTIQNAKIILGERIPTGGTGIRAVVQGTITRQSETEYTIRSARLSLCDCGGAEEPTWTLRAPKVEMTLPDRATLYFPVLWITPIGNLELPIAPIPAPLSLPLEPRAFGLLPPMIEFNASHRPSVQLPLFIPLGTGWDLTLAPGNRFEWSLPNGSAWRRLDAPQLYARARFHPTPTLKGFAEFNWVHDSVRGNAISRAASQIESANDLNALASAYGVAQNQEPSELQRQLTNAIAQADPRYAFANRVHIKAGHSWIPNPQNGIFSNFQWVSDDFLLSDLSIQYDDQIAYIVPSRFRWISDSKSWRIHARFDFLQRLSNYQYDTPRTAVNYASEELKEPSLGPFLEASLKPLSLAPWLIFATSSSLLRIGGSDLTFNADRWRLLQNATFTAHGFFDSVRYEARQVVLGGVIAQKEQAAKFASVISELRLTSPWHNSRRNFSHTLAPEINVRNIESLQSEQLFSYLEESELSSSTQLLLKLDQTFQFGSRKARELRASIQIPANLRRQTFLPFRVTSSLTKTFGFSTQLSMTVSPRGRPFRDLGAHLRWSPHSKIRVGFDYLLLTPRASRLEASLWQFAEDETLMVPSGDWVHGLRPRVSLDIGQRFRLDYRTDIALPAPRDSEDRRTQILLHTAELEMGSTCRHCWQAVLRAQLRPERSQEAADLRLQVAFSLSGFDLE